MAIKGVLIDIKKKYKMGNGTKITEFSKIDSKDYPIIAYYFSDVTHREEVIKYTEDGFFFADKSFNRCDLELDEVVDEEWPKHTHKRKIVQLAVMPESDTQFPKLFASTDDGNIYYMQLLSEIEPWKQLPPIPQD